MTEDNMSSVTHLTKGDNASPVVTFFWLIKRDIVIK